MPLSSVVGAQSIVRPGVCTSSTRPASPYDGQVIYMTDVDQTAVWDGTQWTVLSPIAGGRNYIINGGLDVWQRGTSFTNPTSGSGFVADRFFPVYDGSGATRVLSQGQFDPYVSGASITASPPTGLTPKYFLRWNQSAAGSGATYNILYANRIEDVRRIAGKTVTLSFYAKAAASLTMPKIDIEQSFGTGGSPSSNVYTDVTSSVSVTTSWQRFSFSFTVPSAAGKVIGNTDNTSYTSIRLWLPINTTFTYDIWGVQLEAGAVATPFEFEDYGTTLQKCLRYFWRHAPTAISYLNFIYGGSQSRLTIPFPVVMRVAPHTVTATGWGGGTTPSSSSLNVDAINFYAASGSYYLDNGSVITVSAEL